MNVSTKTERKIIVEMDEIEAAFLADFLHDALRQPGSYNLQSFTAGEKLLELLDKYSRLPDQT